MCVAQSHWSFLSLQYLYLCFHQYYKHACHSWSQPSLTWAYTEANKEILFIRLVKKKHKTLIFLMRYISLRYTYCVSTSCMGYLAYWMETTERTSAGIHHVTVHYSAREAINTNEVILLKHVWKEFPLTVDSLCCWQRALIAFFCWATSSSVSEELDPFTFM